MMLGFHRQNEELPLSYGMCSTVRQTQESFLCGGMHCLALTNSDLFIGIKSTEFSQQQTVLLHYPLENGFF